MKQRPAGTSVIAAIVLLNLLLWVLFPPPPDGSPDYSRQVLSEAIGSTAVLLLAAALLLATRARWLESRFGGMDKVYRSHRDLGLIATLLLIGHVVAAPWNLPTGGGVPSGLIAFVGFMVLVLLTIGPRLPVLDRIFGISYRSWRRTHRFIGLFFLISLAHMLLVGSLVHDSAPLFGLLLAGYGVGILSYLYTLLLARFVRPTYRYLVSAVNRLSGSTVEVVLRPRKRRRLTFTAGQFVFVTFRRRGLREPHPFTVSSAPGDDELRLTIKAAGDFTNRLQHRLDPGRKATVEGSYGMLNYRMGRRKQIWVAGGIGVTPFLSWIRDLPADGSGRFEVDFFYTVRHPEDALFWDEIQSVASGHRGLRVHLHISRRDGSLTVDRVAEASRGGLRGKEIYMCGPVPMVRSFQRRFRRAGVPASAIHFEEFSFR